MTTMSLFLDGHVTSKFLSVTLKLIVTKVNTLAFELVLSYDPSLNAKLLIYL